MSIFWINPVCLWMLITFSSLAFLLWNLDDIYEFLFSSLLKNLATLVLNSNKSFLSLDLINFPSYQKLLFSFLNYLSFFGVNCCVFLLSACPCSFGFPQLSWLFIYGWKKGITLIDSRFPPLRKSLVSQQTSLPGGGLFLSCVHKSG